MSDTENSQVEGQTSAQKASEKDVATQLVTPSMENAIKQLNFPELKGLMTHNVAERPIKHDPDAKPIGQGYETRDISLKDINCLKNGNTKLCLSNKIELNIRG